MSNTPKSISALIPKYIQIVEGEEVNSELYKWEAIEHFQENWDIDAIDFQAMFSEAFKKKENLIYQNSFGFLNSLSKNFPEDLRSLFRNIYDETKPLAVRVLEHQSKSDELLEKLKRKIDKSNYSHQQDERTISFLLVLRFPEKHFLYKSNVYEAYCRYIGVKPRKAGDKLFHFEELCKDVQNEISVNIKLLDLDFVTQVKENFAFESLNLIIQDIIYRVLIVDVEKESRIELLTNIFDDIQSLISEKDHSIQVHNWVENGAEKYRQVSIFPDGKTGLMHYELMMYKEIAWEFHAEGNNDFKYFIEPFVQEYDKTKYDLVPWKCGFKGPVKKGTFNKVVAKNKLKIVAKKGAEYNQMIEDLTNQIVELYNDTNDRLIEYLKNDQSIENVLRLKINEMKNTPLNQILYGPPGTGKTYFTKNTALEIIGLELDNMDRVSIQKEFDKGLKDGRIVFTTFHQSMSYEDFIEGIKPVIDQKDDSDEGSNEETVKYEIVDGIFKEACENAKVLKEFVNTDTPKFYIPEEVFKDKKFFKISLGNTLKDSGDIVYDFCKENNYIGIGWGSDIDYTGVKSRKDIRTRLTSAGVEVGKMDFNISAIERFTLWMRKGDIVFASHGNRQLKAVGVITGEYEFKSSEDSPLTGYNHFRKVEWKILDAKIPVGKVYEKNFSQQSIYELYTKNVKPEFFTQSTPADTSINDNYVIIIDEINRGNVSQIFGELITLIEEDKRSGKDEALEVTLPYSKDKFSVPPNLYIIGTMNTADRSVEALDTALRRRFSFKEMMPNPELLSEERDNGKTEIEGINLEQLLKTINERIEVLVDRDHTIGHSYFLNVQSEEDLKDVFKDKVIPLLQEYFFGDYSKMEMVIGSYFFKKELPKVTFAVTNENYYEERKRYVFKDFDDADFDIITALKELLLIKEQVAVES